MDTKAQLRMELRQLLQKEGLPEPEDDFLLWKESGGALRRVTLDVAWPEARVAVLLEAPPYTGGLVHCNECGAMITRSVPGTDRVLPMTAPNLHYRPDWQGYNLAVECGWRLLRVDRKGVREVIQPLMGLLTEQQAPQVLPAQGRISLARGAVAGWLMAQSPAVTYQELKYRTGWSSQGCLQGMKTLQKWLPIEQLEPGLWRWKRGKVHGKD